MLIIKSSGNLDKLNAILDKLTGKTEQFIILYPASKDYGTEEVASIYRLGGNIILVEDNDWLWVTDDNWDGDLSGILPSVG